MKNKAHPYNYSEDKNMTQRLIDFGVPFLLFWLYFQFYNFGQFNPKEMVKTTGLLAIALLSLTLLIGPASRFFPALNALKANRKFWGILSFFIALAHTILIYIFYVNYDLAKLFDPTSPKYFGLLAGLASLVILLAVTLTSNKLALNSLSPKIWKIIQSTAYLALILAVLHFYLVESQNGVLVIKRIVGQITFGFTALVVLLRLIVAFFPSKK
ncbi:MAG: ferric reductase-like transmembrane domain-containing protein [Candidatus Daviesbacteria bacterium]|nr:ferric reductase-like transmembrane domain-containing protein [Candidatus Daviesbacteria bacterium]